MSQSDNAPAAQEGDALQTEIEREIESNTILVYGKGTKTAPRCGFTLETIEFFNKFGYPFEVVDALRSDAKRARLSEITNWPTLPKVFIDGVFYGDTDILGPMDESGELKAILTKAFQGQEPAPSNVINISDKH
jgi:monothiol glutaredoxin